VYGLEAEKKPRLLTSTGVFRWQPRWEATTQYQRGDVAIIPSRLSNACCWDRWNPAWNRFSARGFAKPLIAGFRSSSVRTVIEGSDIAACSVGRRVGLCNVVKPGYDISRATKAGSTIAIGSGHTGCAKRSQHSTRPKKT